MEIEEKNKEGSQFDINNKQSVISSDTNNTFKEKVLDEVHQAEHQNIKINEQKLKNAKEKTMEIKSESNKEQNINEEINQKNNNLYIHERKCYFKINRFLRGRRKKIILTILLIFSSFFLVISLLDLINSFKNIFNGDELFINKIIIFIFQTVYISSLLIFQILNIISERKDNFIINLIFLVILCSIMVLKIFLYMKKFSMKQITIINLLICFCLTLINLIILLITLRIIKMKKNEQQNIEEIINFTDMPQGTGIIKINERKDNQLILNNSETDNRPDDISNNKKEGMTDLIEEINKSENDVDKTSQGQK